MLCTDIKIDASIPEQAFIQAWNHLVDNKETYLPEWQQAKNSDNLLKAYRAMELKSLVGETRCINIMPHALMLKTLEHIEVRPDGKFTVIFLAGTKI